MQDRDSYRPDYECITLTHKRHKGTVLVLHGISAQGTSELYRKTVATSERCLKYNVDSELAYSIQTAENNTSFFLFVLSTCKEHKERFEIFLTLHELGQVEGNIKYTTNQKKNIRCF